MNNHVELWLWCIRTTVRSMTMDIIFAWNDGDRETLVSLFNVAWILYGGTVGDILYNDYVATFSLEKVEVSDGLGGIVEVYKFGASWWEQVVDYYNETPIEDRVCKMPRWD